MSSKDYSVPVLDGAGDNDYARYMRTDALRFIAAPARGSHPPRRAAVPDGAPVH